MTAADSSVLLPVHVGATDKCRQANIKFACVQLNLNFSALVTLQPPSNTILCAEYYIELPQDSWDMTVAFHQAYRLTTYLGHGDLQAMTAKESQRDILSITLQDGPVNLRSPTFNLTLVRMDDTNLVSKRYAPKSSCLLPHPSLNASSINSAQPTPRSPMPPLTTSGRHTRTQRATLSSNQFSITTRKSWALLVHLLTKIPFPPASARYSLTDSTLILLQGFAVTSPIIAFHRLSLLPISARLWKQ